MIPEVIRKDKRLSLLSKLIYGEILSLSNNKSGVCTASCGYFGKIYGRAQLAIRRSISELQECGYIDKRLDRPGGNTWTLRPLVPCIENDITSVQKTSEVKSKKNYPSVQKPTQNNTSITRNRTSIAHDTGFDTFWSVYPRKIAKQNALKSWNRIHPEAQLVLQIISAVRCQSKSDQWQRDGGQFIPYPATWLNGRRCEDQQDGGKKNVTATVRFGWEE